MYIKSSLPSLKPHLMLLLGLEDWLKFDVLHKVACDFILFYTFKFVYIIKSEKSNWKE